MSSHHDDISGGGTLSMRDKSRLKKRINEQHNSNLRAGYVHIDERQLQRTGLRGRKACVFTAVIVLLAVIAVCNVAVTIALSWVLHINQNGMETLEFTPNGRLLRFIGHSDLDSIVPLGGVVSGLPRQNLELSAEQQAKIVFKVGELGTSSVSVQEGRVTVTAGLGFKVIDPTTSQVVFSSSDDEERTLPRDVHTLHLHETHTNRVVSKLDDDLKIEGRHEVNLHGEDGVKMDGGDIYLAAEESIDLTTKAKLVLESDGGAVYLEQLKHLALAGRQETAPAGRQEAAPGGRRLCICAASGRLFVVSPRHRCDDGASACVV